MNQQTYRLQRLPQCNDDLFLSEPCKPPRNFNIYIHCSIIKIQKNRDLSEPLYEDHATQTSTGVVTILMSPSESLPTLDLGSLQHTLGAVITVYHDAV
ncbi:hypothetical protein ASF12_09045 [Paenibacillus sp. Leaf72]|nr:hypothetical protein ASF12_09045 [Paenibacillus sp. Leaf72]